MHFVLSGVTKNERLGHPRLQRDIKVAPNGTRFSSGEEHSSIFVLELSWRGIHGNDEHLRLP